MPRTSGALEPSAIRNVAGAPCRPKGRTVNWYRLKGLLNAV